MSAASQGSILVVDDDRLVLATLVHGLTQAGYRVIDADNGDDAILLAREHRPDLALLDIRMQGLSGFDVAAYLREHERTPFMFLSAFSDDATARRVAELGAVDWLVKPLDIGRILPAVAAALARAETLNAGGGAARSSRAGGAAVAASAGVPTGRLEAASAVTTLSLPTARAVAGQVPGPVTSEVAMAAGVLMHRFSLRRDAALARLERLASADGRSLAEQAAQVLGAVESMALPDAG